MIIIDRPATGPAKQIFIQRELVPLPRGGECKIFGTFDHSGFSLIDNRDIPMRLLRWESICLPYLFAMNWKYLISLSTQHNRGSRTSISITVLVDFFGWWLVGQLALGGSLWFWQKCANGGKCARASLVREKSWVKVEFCLQQPEPSAACRPTYPLPEIGTGLQLAWLAPQAGADPGLAGSPGPALAPCWLG